MRNNTSIKFKKLLPSEIFDQFSFDQASYKSLSKDKWNLNSEATDTLFAKLNSQPWTVDDVFSSISQGVVSVGDDIFLMKGKIQGDKFVGFSDRLGKEIILEAGSVKPLLKGENVKKYAPITNNYYCLYPHHLNNHKTAPFEEEYFKENYPMAYNYILPFKDELIEKKVRYKTNPKAWYSLHRSREISLFEQDKIVTPETSLGGNLSIDNGNHYHNTQVYSLIKKDSVKEDYKFWLAILNSSVFWFFLQQTGAVLRGGYFRFKTKYLEPFPLPKPENTDEQNPIIEKVELMLSNTQKFQDVIGKFVNFIEAQFVLEKLTKKLQNWNDLDFSDFIKELNKAIKKENKSRVKDNKDPIKKLSKLDEMEWMEIFDTKKSEAETLKSEIDKANSEIDRMVYSLYELSGEEIEMIERTKAV